MYNYIKGIIESLGPNFISLENNGIGYLIYVPNPYNYQVDEEYKVYLYNYIREDENTLYGFKSEKDRDFFLKLINVKGVGPKMALPLLSASVDSVYDAIERENILYLTKFPKIGDKVARQIILDLKGKLVKNSSPESNRDLSELCSVLDSLGYKKADYKSILAKIDTSLPVEKQVKEALKLLQNR